jgi:cytochrome c oxidase subunit I+III
VSIVFGYFFYWTARPDFPPDPVVGPGIWWPTLALLLLVASWGCTVLARRLNRLDSRLIYGALATAVVFAVAGIGALLAGPWTTALNPSSHVYAAIVWLLAIWTAAHVGAGVIMHLYCIARRIAGRMTAGHDQDIVNITLYWHFVALMTLVTVAVIAGFPLVMT